VSRGPAAIQDSDLLAQSRASWSGDMEIERLPFGQSHADKCRAGHCKWLNAPPGMSSEMAIEFMEKLKAGTTIRKLTGGGKLGPAMVSRERFLTHCKLNPD
jgi:hypothetical protein